MAEPSLLGVGVINDYTHPGTAGGAISQVDSTGTVNAGVVTQINSGNTFNGHDPRILGFFNTSDSQKPPRALVADYNYQAASTYGVFTPRRNVSTWGNPENISTSTDWHTNNPYSIVTNGNDMYIMGYDQNTIVKINTTNYTYTNTFYTYTPLTGKTGHGVDMDKITIGNTDYIVALFSNDDGSYGNYGDSQLVILDFSGKTISTCNLNANANSLNINITGNTPHAYITSYGGPQNAGGNNGSPYTSKLQIVDLTPPSTVIQTIGPKTTPVDAGDYIDVALVGSYAYVLTANYNDDFSQYTYMLVKVSQANLLNGTFDGNSSYTATVDSGATWLLAYDGTVLWFVAGKQVYTIDTSVAISSSALTLRANANDHSSDSQGLGISGAYGQLNTASVVIPYSATAGVSRAAARSAVSGGHTKFAKVMLPREVLEKLGRA
ncbi:hypothetical protein [Pectinatus cerevisiiphilus]|uniref:Uncharacterized protein n=1 Tax=Pectinatus cerevisiiphilus TaxID=86956 RepID=A0A4V2USG7_9FIRM|nr:hypothetical protein [Pectinatus cerevisiiphilus]TCS81362.1 hypothetical protein EDC37_10258 [Pectinatus cerevisiiphilus]